MTPERWRRAQEVFLTATERETGSRATYLQEACRDDPELREEVESLLATYDAAPPGFLESPAIEGVPALPLSEGAGPRAVGKGMRLGPYEILAPLGAGGMGEVYRARDERLGREVAIKVLSPELSQDASRVKRFEKEARSASALNHPNIVTIYDTGASEGVAWIAMEKVDGETLRKLVSSGPVPIKKLLPIATQVAEGLSRAHEAGIVHRDLKPENVMVTKDGLVKILDFGLAKLSTTGSGSDEGTRLPTVSGTTPGVIMGTVGYMSPEQASGSTVDFRSDQFSLGSILYEMVTGSRAFQGKTPIDVLGAILNDEPQPIAGVNPLAPTQLRWIVERCLAKEPRQRYSSTDDLARDLATLRDHLSEATSGPAPGARAERRLWRPILVGVVALLLVGGAIFRFTRRQPPPRLPLRVRQLTSNSNENPVGSGEMSLDGKYLAYTDRTGMHVKLIETGEVRTVPEPEALKGREMTWEIGPWHPDGTRFFVNAHPATWDSNGPSSRGTSIWSVLVMGGPPRRLRDEAQVISVSPDGSSVAFGTKSWARPNGPGGTTEEGDREIWSMGPGGEKAHKLLEADPNGILLWFMWFRDGHRVVYSRTAGSVFRLLSQDLGSGAVTTMLPSKLVDPVMTDKSNSVAWSPDGRLIYSIPEPERDSLTGDSCNFWELPINPHTGEVLGKPRRLTSWTGFCVNASGTIGEGKRLAFLKWAGHNTVYLAALDASGTAIGTPTHLTLSENASWPIAWTADGKTLVLQSDRSGHDAIYTQSLNDETLVPLAVGPEDVEGMTVSPDGAWAISRTKAVDASTPVRVLSSPISGGPAQLVMDARPDAFVSCARSPATLCVLGEPTEDRKHVVFTAFDPVKGRGTELARIESDPNSRYPAWRLSPDGTRIAARLGPDGVLSIVPPEALISILSLQGQPTERIKVKGWAGFGSLGWASDGKTLFVGSADSSRTAVLLRVDLQGNATVVCRLPGFNWVTGVVSPDGRHVAIGAAGTGANMWMMENF